MNTQAFDVIVVGCGLAGLSAAVSAAEHGAGVALLERAVRSDRGGQSRYTEAYLRMKSETEVSDDFETHLAENGSGYVDPDLVEEAAGPRETQSNLVKSLSMVDPGVLDTFAMNAGPTVAWLRELGARFDFLPTAHLTTSQPRLLAIGGGLALIEALAARAESLGVTFFYETTATGLRRGASGQVIGLSATNRQTGAIEFSGKVVLGSGGFEGNSEMLTRYLGPRSVFLRPICKGGYYNRGEGIQMALDAGAAPCGDFGSYHGEPVDPRSGKAEPAIFIYPYGILVNKEGRRFTDEAARTVDEDYERITRRVIEQRDGLVYAILDSKHTRIPNYRRSIKTDKPPILAESVQELAAQLSLPTDALAETLQEYNRACVPGEFKPLQLDGLATRGLVPAKSNWALPLDELPYHAYPIISCNTFTLGGIKVDTNARVLDRDGEPIAGLYAAGEVIGMYYARNCTGATSVLKGLVFGRIAGADAARH